MSVPFICKGLWKRRLRYSRNKQRNNKPMSNQTLRSLKRNIQVHIQDLKSTSYKILTRSQFEYASTVWSPYTAADIYKTETVQRRATRWITCDYQQTSRATAMLGNLNWRPLDQRRIDNRLVMMYTGTYDLVVIRTSEYLKPNRRESKCIQPLEYKQICQPFQIQLLPSTNRTLKRKNSK